LSHNALHRTRWRRPERSISCPEPEELSGAGYGAYAMSASPQLVGQNVHVPGSARYAAELAWGLLGAAGFAFAIVAGTDIALTLLPARFGDVTWEFDSVTAMLRSMPLLAVGLILGYAASLTRSRRGALRGWSSVMIGVAAFLTAAFGLYLVLLPDVYTSVPPGPVRQELMKGMVKTLCQGVLYPAVLCWLGVQGWVLSGES